MNFQNVSLLQSIKEDLRNISQSDLKLRSPSGKPLGRMWLQTLRIRGGRLFAFVMLECPSSVSCPEYFS
jgi:hypothetical protein